MKIPIKIIIATACLLFSPALLAQKNNYKPGYVVLVNGDTLKGQVMDRDESAFGGLLKKIKFRNTRGRKKKYKPSQLKYYQRDGDLFKSIWISSETRMFKQKYFSREGQGDQVFVKVVYRGSVDLYHWEFTDEDNSSVDYIPLIKKVGSNELVRTTQGVFGMKRKRLAEYFADCPDLSFRIRTKYIVNVMDLIEFYENNCQGP